METLLGTPEVETEVSEEMGVPEQSETEIAVPCGSWCFLFGVGFQATCPLPSGHENDHMITVEIFQEPKSFFTIYWRMTDSVE